MAPATPNHLDVPKDIGDWLSRANALAAKHMKRSQRSTDCVEVDQRGTRDIIDGTAVCRVLTHYAKDSNQIPHVDSLKEESTAGARLHNWNMLTVALAEFGVQLDPDMKGLIVGGDTDVVLDVLRELRAKTDNARRRRGSADTRRGSVSSEREAGQNASSTEASSEVSLDLRKLDTCQNLEESSNALDFLVISMCKKLGVRAKQAAALLTANTKYLSHMMEKGIKGSFEAVDAWYAEVFKNNALLAELMASHPSTIPFVLSTLKWAFTSENEESSSWMNRIFANLAKPLQEAGFGNIMYEWLVQAPSGSTPGLAALVKGLKLHPDTSDSVYGVIIQIADGKLPEVFEKHLPRLLGPQEYMELVQGFLPRLRGGRTTKGEPLLGRGGLANALLGLTVKFGASENTEECRIQAFGMLARLWSDCAEELVVRGEALEFTLEVLKKGTRASSGQVQHEAQTDLFTILDALGSISHSEGLNTVYKTLVFIMLEAPNGDPLHATLCEHLAERLRKNSQLSPAIVVEPLMKQVRMEGATGAEAEFIAVIAAHHRLTRAHAALLAEGLGGVWVETEEGATRTTLGDTLLALVTRFKNEQAMASAVGNATRVMLAVFGQTDEVQKGTCVEVLSRVAQAGGSAVTSALITELSNAVSKYGEHDRLHNLLAKLGGAKPGKGHAAPPPEPQRRKSAARNRQVDPAYEAEGQGRRQEAAPPEVPNTRPKRHTSAAAERKPRPDKFDSKHEKEPKVARRERKSKSPTGRTEQEACLKCGNEFMDDSVFCRKCGSERAKQPPVPTGRRQSAVGKRVEEAREDNPETEEQRAIRKRQQAKLRAKRLEELRAIKRKREEDEAREKAAEENRRARSADIKGQLAAQRKRDHERLLADRAAKQQADYEHQKEIEANPEKPARSAPEASTAKKPFWEREDTTHEVINHCVNKYPHEQRLMARDVCELVMEVIDVAIDPASHFKDHVIDKADKADKADKRTKSAFKRKERKLRQEVAAAKKDETSDSDTAEAAELLQQRLEKEKARLERAERAHAKIAAYRARRAEELQEMAAADAKLDAMKKEEQEKRREEEKKKRNAKKEEVREWREKQYQEEKEKEQEKKKAEFEHKRERQQLVKDYLDRKERRELKKQVDMETIEHDKDEEEANQVETASLAKGDKTSARRRRRKKEEKDDSTKKRPAEANPKEGKASGSETKREMAKQKSTAAVDDGTKSAALGQVVQDKAVVEENPEPQKLDATQPATGGGNSGAQRVVAPDGTEEDWTVNAVPEAESEADKRGAPDDAAVKDEEVTVPAEEEKEQPEGGKLAHEESEVEDEGAAKAPKEE